ncbi:MAG: IclR family transcriptional regulator [Xanthobacteraceae bacterium]
MSNIRDPLARAFQLLRWFTRERLDSIGVREAATALSVAPSTAHNLLVALAAEGVLQQDDRTGRYALGCELFQLAHQAIDQVPLRRVAMPYLRRLAATCNEATLLSLYVRERAELCTIAGVDSTHPVRYVIDMFSWRPLHVGASGRAVLAFLPPADRAAIPPVRPAQGSKLSSRPDFTRELVSIRKRGYAVTRGTRIEGAVGIAAPLLDPGGAVLGAVGIAMPEQRFDPTSIERLAKPLLTCVRDLVDELGMAPLSKRSAGSAALNRREPADSPG